MTRTYLRRQYAVAHVEYGRIWQHGAKSLEGAKFLAENLTTGSFAYHKGMTWIESPYFPAGER